VRFGAHIYQADEGLSTSRLAVEVESRGFESLRLPEHTHIPTSRGSPYLTPELPREYPRVLDPFIALTVAATATARLRLGMGICLLPSTIRSCSPRRLPVWTECRAAEFSSGSGWAETSRR
jgi:alkanesulfonate monooxygenase SsuD/methylene tetrahydromethanopterin reductase-like flavin-dependent oxidoreductase (luciferase family)